MGFFDSGIIVTVNKRDAQGRDLGDVAMVLREGKRDGVYLIDASRKGNPIIKRFDPASTTVFRIPGGQERSVFGRAALGWVIAGPAGGVIGGLSGTGKNDASFLEIVEKDGSSMAFGLKNQADGKSMEKRIARHIQGFGAKAV